MIANPEQGPSPEELGLQQDPGTAKTDSISVEEAERRLDVGLEEVLRFGVEKINEGNNGIVCKANIEKFSPDMIAALEVLDVTIDKDPAIKILKVYAPGAGKKEYDAHVMAYEAIEKYSKNKSLDLARVPKPLLYRELKNMAPETLDQLHAFGFKGQAPNAEILVMELVDGQDLETIYFKEILKRHKEAAKTISNVDEHSRSELATAVESFLKLQPSSVGDAETRAKTTRENSSAMYKFLAKNGFSLEPSLRKQVSNTLIALHREGIAHRDAHERNVMVVGDPTGGGPTKPEAYLIDFGLARTFTKGKYGDHLYGGPGGERYLPDEELPRRLDSITGTGK